MTGTTKIEAEITPIPKSARSTVGSTKETRAFFVPVKLSRVIALKIQRLEVYSLKTASQVISFLKFSLDLNVHLSQTKCSKCVAKYIAIIAYIESRIANATLLREASGATIVATWPSRLTMCVRCFRFRSFAIKAIAYPMIRRSRQNTSESRSRWCASAPPKKLRCSTRGSSYR